MDRDVLTGGFRVTLRRTLVTSLGLCAILASLLLPVQPVQDVAQ